MDLQPFPVRFFKRIFQNILTTHKLDVEIRCLNRDRTKHSRFPKQFWCNSIRELRERWLDILELNRNGYDVHFTVVGRRRRFQGKKEHPLPKKPVFCCFWADIDVGKDKRFKNVAEALHFIRNRCPRPNIVIRSGRGLHVYYVLRKPIRINTERVERLLRAIRNGLQADSGAARATRLMRVPNTRNWKYLTQERICAAKFLRKKKYALKQLESLWQAAPDKNRKDNSEEQELQTSQTTDYYDLFKPHVKHLERSGENARGLCPFHDDTHPSFSVNVHTGRWICFACGRDGNWSQFRKEKGLSILELEGEGPQADESFDWGSLPRFDPTEAPDTVFLVEHFIPERGITLLVGASGVYKSTVTLVMASAISKGEKFLDRETKKRRVLYLDNENPPDVLKVRNDSLCLEMETNKKLRLWSLYGGRPVPRIEGPELARIVKKCVAKNKKPLIILDHWASFLRPGEGGETTGQITPLMQALKRLCALGATIVILAHTRKYEKGVEYGGADLRAKADAIHTFTLHLDGGDVKRPVIRIECFLKRHGGPSSFAIRPKIGEGEVVGFQIVEDPVKEERREKQRTLRQLIQNNPDFAKGQLIKAAQDEGLSRDEARRILEQGEGEHWETEVGPRGKQTLRLIQDE